jgi:threonine dehydrogenase-like Zn-dependent dehydrogenase
MTDRILFKAGPHRCLLTGGHGAAPDGPSGRLVRAGVCGTDVQILQGKREDRARILGHEGLALWDTGTGPQAAVFNPVDPHDQDRILGHSYDGIFRDHVVYPPADEGGPRLVAADPDLPLDLAPLTEPLGTVLYAWDLIGAPATVGVWGAGATAALHALVAVSRGVRTVVVHPRPERLRWFAERLPAAADSGLLRTTTDPAAASPLDAAVLCTHRDAVLPALGQALEAVDAGGCIDLFGGVPQGAGHPDLPGVDLAETRRANACGLPPGGHRRTVTDVRGKPLVLTGHRGTGDRHLRRAQRLLADNADLFTDAVTDVVSLESAGDLLNTLARRTPGRDERRWLKVVIDFSLPAGRRRPVDPAAVVADLVPTVVP